MVCHLLVLEITWDGAACPRLPGLVLLPGGPVVQTAAKKSEKPRLRKAAIKELGKDDQVEGAVPGDQDHSIIFPARCRRLDGKERCKGETD